MRHLAYLSLGYFSHMILVITDIRSRALRPFLGNLRDEDSTENIREPSGAQKPIPQGTWSFQLTVT